MSNYMFFQFIGILPSTYYLSPVQRHGSATFPGPGEVHVCVGCRRGHHGGDAPSLIPLALLLAARG